jgi:2-phosphoglycerate kinase
MGRGLSFEDAYRIANRIRDRLHGRGVVPRQELAQELHGLLGAEALREEPPPLPQAPSIHVSGRGRGSPFSKGFLSQSLLAAAIDPNDAFDVARDIERQLVSRSVRDISRRDLRRLAYETLKSRLGPRSAERYLVWRCHQEPDRPVILLLGGTAGAGKSSLAAEVAHRLGIHRVVSTDAIRQVMRIMLSPELVPAIHASSYETQGILGGGSKEDPVIEGFLAQASTVSVGVRATMDRSVAENASLILDGVSIVPGLIDCSAYAGAANVIFLVVVTLDPDAFRSRFAARARDAPDRPTHRYLKHLDAILKIQDHFLELAEEHDIPIVDNRSFDGSVLSIIRHVTETLRTRGDFDAASLL